MEPVTFKLKVTTIERRNAGGLRVKATDATMKAVVYYDYDDTGMVNLDQRVKVTIEPDDDREDV